MGAVIVLITLLSVSARLDAAISLASGAYYQNFDGTLESDWVLSNLATASIPLQGRTVVTNVANGSTNYSGTIIQNANGGYGNIGDTFAPIKAADSYMNYGFGGKWLTNTNGLSYNGLENKTDLVRTATVTFDQLGKHETVSLQLLIGAGDSIDSGEGIFEIWIDGSKVWSRQFGSSGNISSSPPAGFSNVGPAPTPLVTNANLINSGFYFENWNADATIENQRSAASWVLEGAYSLDFSDIAHTADTMTLQFVWRALEGASSDEFIAIDNLLVTVPEPGYTALFILGIAGFAVRRRRRA